MQQMLGTLQQKCFSIGEKLIENETPFKKAPKAHLRQSLLTLSGVQQQLQKMTKTFNNVHTQLATIDQKNVSKPVCFDRVTKILQSQEKILQQVQRSCVNDVCLAKCT